MNFAASPVLIPVVKQVRYRHPPTLHLWWALASWWVMLLALLLPDPRDPHCPEAFKREARRQSLPVWKGRLGGGDIKLLAMIGAFLGWQHVCMTVFLASCAGALVGIGLMAFRCMERGQYIPFGPFLALGAVASLFFYQELFGMYEAMFL